MIGRESSLCGRRCLRAALGALAFAFVLVCAPAAQAQDFGKESADAVVKRLLADTAVEDLKGETIVVSQFQAADIPEDQAALFQDKLITALVQSKFFTVVERGKLDEALKELKLQASGLTTPDAQKEIGKLTNAAYILLGSVTKVAGRPAVTGRLVEIETGKAKAAVSYQAGGTKKKGGRKRIAIVQFQIPSEWHWGSHRLGEVLADMMITDLVKSGAFDVMERTEIDALLKEQSLSAEGILDPSSAAANGQKLGVDYILGGKVTEFGMKENKAGGFGQALGGIGLDLKSSVARAAVDARVVDCTTGKILMAVSGKGEEKTKGISASKWDVGSINFDSNEWEGSQIGKATRKAVTEVMTAISANFPVQSLVKMVDEDGSLILGIGKFGGIKEGAEFEIIREKEVKDDETGEVVFSKRTKIGTAKVTEVQDESCLASFTPAKAGDTAKKGDLAVLPKK